MNSDAPPKAQDMLLDLRPRVVREVPVEPEAGELAEAYVERRILTRKSLDDAMHVAVATV